MNIRYLNYSLIILSAIAVISCGHKDDKINADITYNLSKTSQGSIDDVFCDLEVIPLFFDGDRYPKNVMNVTVSDSYIFILDINRIFHIFSAEGKYLSNSSSKIGQGPGEYSILMGYSWNPYSKMIEILTPDRLLFYDIDFNFKKSCAVPSNTNKNLIFGQVGDLSANEHILLPTGISENPDRVMFYDSSTEKITSESDYSKDVIAPSGFGSKFLFHDKDSVLFCPPAMTPYIYNISKNTLDRPVIEFEYGKNAITRHDVEEHNSSEEELRNYLMTCHKDIRMANFITTPKIFTLFKHGNKLSDTFVVITDRINHKSISINLYTNNEQSFPIIYDSDSSFVYSVIDKSSLLNSTNLMLGDKKEIAEKISKIDDEDFVLLKYKVKNAPRSACVQRHESELKF